MASPSHRELLQSVLDELQEHELKRFKARLNQGGLLEGCPSISKARLEKADTLDVTDLMVNTYTTSKALAVAREALVAINQRELAARLEGY